MPSRVLIITLRFRNAEHITRRSRTTSPKTKHHSRNAKTSLRAQASLVPSRLREGLGWAVSTRTKKFAPKLNPRRNIIKMKKSAAADFFLYLHPKGATSFVRSATSCALCGARGGQSTTLPYNREVLTLSKIPKRSFVILKRGGASSSSRISSRLRLELCLRNFSRKVS